MVRTAVTGSHATGHHLNEAAEQNRIMTEAPSDGLLWIEREYEAKQGMARKGDMQDARAAPDRPHLPDRPRTGGRQ